MDVIGPDQSGARPRRQFCQSIYDAACTLLQRYREFTLENYAEGGEYPAASATGCTKG